MNEDTGEIKDYKNVPPELVKSNKDAKDDDGNPIPEKDRTWSDSFYKNEIIEVKGIKMQIIKIKQLRGEIILKAVGKTK